MNILGVRYGHDSSAALTINGEIIADVAEERFSRAKNDTSFPLKSIEFCLNKANISSEDIDILAIPSRVFQEEFSIFFDIPDSINPTKKNLIKSKIRDIYIDFKNLKSNLPVLPKYQKKIKLSKNCKIKLIDHHLCHISSAAYTSGINIDEKVLGFTMDGIGDNTSVAVWEIHKNKIKNKVRFNGSGSLGWFYANCTEAMDWRHGSEEWKVMGLAPYGKPKPGSLDGFHPVYKNGKLDKPFNYPKFGIWKDHGSNHYHGIHSYEIGKIFNSMKDEDFAAEVQRISEEQAFNVILPWIEKTKINKIVCAGGFFLNVKFNQKLWYKNILKEQWIYPNPGDAGLAVGACLHEWFLENSDIQHKKLDSLYTGPEFSNKEIKEFLDDRQIKYNFINDIELETAKLLSKNYVIGWFQGKMEAGPRALGNRSIIMSPIDPKNKDLINAKVKYREKFRPFCPSIIEDYYYDYMLNPREESFMVTSFEAKKGIKERIPAVVHHDNSARPQMVKKRINKRYYNLIKEFGKITNESVILNTSFNIKGEPIVCNPREAIKCFYDTGLDCLVLGNYLIKKENIG